MPPYTPPPTSPPPLPEISGLVDPGEQTLTIVRRTVIGIIAIYLEALLAIVAILAVILLLAPDLFSSLTDQSQRLLMGGIVFALALLIFILFIATTIYRENKLIVTDQSLVQVLQKTLFNRKVSRLSMSNVEDVNAEQRGIPATIFNYGTLVVQTAGEMENFIFPWCPNPNFYAQQILEARQAYAEKLEEGKET